MKAKFPFVATTLVAVLSVLPSGCSDDKPEGPKNNPQRNAAVNPGPVAEGTGVFGAKGANQAQQGTKEGQPVPQPQPQQSATVSAILTYEVCQGAKDGQPGKCTTGSSPCQSAMEIPLERSEQDGTLSGTAEVTQSVGPDLVLSGTVALIQNQDGSYLMTGTVGDNHHDDAISQQQLAGNGSLDKMAALKVDSGKQAQADGNYSFSLVVTGTGSDVPACQSPTGSPSQAPTPPEQVPPSQGPAPLPETSAAPSAAPSVSPSAAPSASPAPAPLPVPTPSASIVAS